MARILQRLTVLLCIGVLAGCGKMKVENYEAKIVSDKVDVTATTATFQWEVDFPGSVYSSVDLSENSDMSDAQNYGTGALSEDKHFEVTVENLKGSTNYYYQYKVWNNFNVDQPIVFETKHFTTTLGLPTVVTHEIQQITTVSADCEGEITGDGGLAVTARGLCWGREPNPSLTASEHFSEEGTGTGSFNTHITGLEPNTKYYVRAYATNGKGTSYGNEQVFTTKVETISVKTLEVVEIDTESCLVKCEVTNTGNNQIINRGVCWSKQQNPTIEGSSMNGELGGGDYYECQITGLDDNTTYYVRAYAKSSDGNIIYGEELSFVTLEIGRLEVTTVSIIDILNTSATCLGNVVAHEYDVIQRGACWSTLHSPTIESQHTYSGEGDGDFTASITGLTPTFTYYVRAYAKNSIGRVFYGEELSFTTAEGLKPTVATGSVINITYHGAQISGNVTDDGGFEVTEKGICWDTNVDPTIENDHASYGTGLGIYWLKIDGLLPNTQYYARAYAINSQGVSYGNWVSFTTLEHP